MGKLLLAPAIMLLAFMLPSEGCRAQCSGNQLTTTFSNLASQYGQYIMADCSGELTNFNYQVETGGSAVSLTVRNGSDCSGTVLRTVSYTEGLFNSVNFSPGIPVTSGETYSVVVTNPNLINIKLNTNSNYQTGGLLYGPSCQFFPAANSWDMVFSYSIAAALPVELASFSAKQERGNVRLDWETASETANRGFEIQRSGDGDDWQAIHFEKGHGTTTDRHGYSFLDAKPLAGLNFYRLRQLDIVGKEDFSNIETVEMAGNGRGFSVFPNPVSEGELTILFGEKIEGEISQIRLFNSTGQLVKSIGLSHTMEVDGLPPGIYSLEMGGFFQKIIVQ